MRILILQNHIDDDAAHLATFLRVHDVAFDVIYLGDGATMPKALSAYTGLAILGGPNSVNDDDPALRHTEALIREAARGEKPVLGHCLGGQLIATAFGGKVTETLQPEIGWSQIELSDSDTARQWFGEFAGASRTVFQWHYETFSLPEGAELIASNAACKHQAFAYKYMLAMQFHIEVDETKLTRWSKTSDEEVLPLTHLPTVQSGAEYAQRISTALPQSVELANRIYTRFLQLARRNDAAS